MKPKSRIRRLRIQLQSDTDDTSELELGAYLDKYPEPKIPSSLISQSAFGKVKWRM